MTLDGQPHTITRSLEAIAAAAPAGAKYTLQITGGTLLYGPVREAAALSFSAIRLELPRPGAAAVSGPAPAAAKPAKCVSHRRFVIHLRKRYRTARVTVAGKRVKVRRVHHRLQAVVDLRGFGKRTVKVRVRGRSAQGRKLHETRTYHTCGAKKKAKKKR